MIEPRDPHMRGKSYLKVESEEPDDLDWLDCFDEPGSFRNDIFGEWGAGVVGSPPGTHTKRSFFLRQSRCGIGELLGRLFTVLSKVGGTRMA